MNKAEKRAKGGKARKGSRGKGQPSGPVGPILRRLLGYLKPHKGMLAAVMLAAFLTSAAELAPPLIVRGAIDGLASGEAGTGDLVGAGALLFALSLAQGTIDFARLYLMAYTGQRVVFGVRSAIFAHLSRLSFSFYDRARTGDLMARVTADVDVLNDFFGRAAVIVLTNLLTLAGILIILLSWDWRLGLLYLIFLPIIAHAFAIYAGRVRPAFGRARKALAALTAALRESVSNILVVKLFGREAFEEYKADKQSRKYLQSNLQTARITSFWMPYAHVIMGAATALVLGVGGQGVIDNTLTLGTLAGFVTYINVLMRPIRQTGMMLNSMMRSAAAAERVFEVLDTEPDVRDAPDAYPLPPVEGRVRYEDVTFAYNGSREALRGVSLETEPGELIALVGPSGAGKTTLVHLLPRFYDPQAGRITIDGHDTRAVTIGSLRDAVGVALQTTFLFGVSIGENIAYGSPGAPQGEIEAAARAVQMHDFIRSLPLGYGTPVGERGVRLSGGQRQRIALARVLLTDPHILVLDEPTASVDAETERRMQEAIRNVRAGRTTFVIAHRLWTVQEADQILVLRDGRIVERARSAEGRSAHEILLSEGGFYRDLYTLQLQGETLETEHKEREQA